MSTLHHSQDPDPEIPIQDDPIDPNSQPQSQSEAQTIEEEEESQNPKDPDIPQIEESEQLIPEEESIHHQEDPKCNLEENPEQKSSEDPQNEEESQNPKDSDIPPNKESEQLIPEEETVHHQENPKSNLEETPDQKSSGMAHSVPSAIQLDVDVSPNDGEMSYSPLTSPTNPSRRLNKRKKGKCNTKKQQAIEKRLRVLLENLCPIPFAPSKILDFRSHEKLLKGLGLWEFVHNVDLNQKVRADLIAHLVATYDPKTRSSYVKGLRVAVSRADLARALRLPVKKEKGGGNVNADDVTFSEESIGFIEDFVSIWMLLHEDTWMMPSEVYNWIRVIKDGNPEKVDWAGLLWFMVEKELTQGEQLKDSYYAVHLQYLIKSQRGELFFSEEPENLNLDVEVKEEDDGDDVKVEGGTQGQEEGCMLSGLNIELSLGQDPEKKPDEVKDAEMMDVDEHMGEQQQEEEHEQQPFDGTNEVDEPCLCLCTSKEGMILDGHEESVDLVVDDGVGEGEFGDEQEREDEGFGVLPNNDNTPQEDGLTGNFLQTMEISQIPFSSDTHLHDHSSMELVTSGTDLNATGPSSGYGSKREVERDYDGDYDRGSKRLRTESPWDNNPFDFGACWEEVQGLLNRARVCYEAKSQTVDELNIHNQLLLTECQKRDDYIEHLCKNKLEEIQKRDNTIYRLERELFMMRNIVEGYRKALKDTHKAFGEYRRRAQILEEPIYKDAGPRGLLLSTAEIEKLQIKQEEEYRSNCLMLERKAKEAEEGYAVEFQMYMDKVAAIGARLMSVSCNVEELKELNAKCKCLETHPIVLEAPDASKEE